jgi:hypothetical protein
MSLIYAFPGICTQGEGEKLGWHSLSLLVVLRFELKAFCACLAGTVSLEPQLQPRMVFSLMLTARFGPGMGIFQFCC